jgi:two-component system sensor histidine kinase KdpD
VRRTLIASIGGVALSLIAGIAMVPLRAHLSAATPALILILPVIAAVVVGGLIAGSVTVIGGFLVYDYLFLAPYDQLDVKHPQDLIALVVYAIVMLILARVVSLLGEARSEAQHRSNENHRVFELSEYLVEDRSVDDLLRAIVRAVSTVFDISTVALLALDGDRLEVVASHGEPFHEVELRELDPSSGKPVSLGTSSSPRGTISTVALIAAGQPKGILALRGTPGSQGDREVLRTFANHAALAIERAELREQALRSDLLEEVEQLRHVLIGAVSHDLRTPLATLKVASSTLLEPPGPLSEDDVHELYSLFDQETDRLTRLVESLLDMTRIDAGVLEINPAPTPIVTVFDEAVALLRRALEGREIRIEVVDPAPVVEIDTLLVVQVLANLIENAHRHAPRGTAITLSAEIRNDRVVVAVTDEGPGVPEQEQEAVFDTYMRFDTGGRAGLGLTIVKTFVEAHGESIWVEDVPGGGARFAFTLPLAPGEDQER